jgi:hypothetical protein
MPKFSKYFSLGVSQHELDFVDVSNEFDTPVYVDPYAIEIRDDLWAEEASANVRSFFSEILEALRADELDHAANLMSHLREPRETFLGVSKGEPQGRGVGHGQAAQLIRAIAQSKAFASGIISDLSEMALYVEGVDRDKVSDLTTNIIRGHLVDYTQQQCELHGIETERYSGPPLWDKASKNWVSQIVQLPHIKGDPVLLVPKYIVRRKLSLDSQEFYNKQLTDFLVAEHFRANDALVHVIRGRRKVFKTEVREATPKSKSMIADMVVEHPHLLETYKELAKQHGAMVDFGEDGPTVTAVCGALAEMFPRIPTGTKYASDYHKLVMGSLTALFYPDLIQPHKEWEIHDGRKRIDIVYTNAADGGFFAQRRNDRMTNANTVIVECKNYSTDLANSEIDQLLGRFDNNRGKFGIMTCRKIENRDLLIARCRDASSRSQGYIIVLDDNDIVRMLRAKSQLADNVINETLFARYRELLQ